MLRALCYKNIYNVFLNMTDIMADIIKHHKIPHKIMGCTPSSLVIIDNKSAKKIYTVDEVEYRAVFPSKILVYDCWYLETIEGTTVQLFDSNQDETVIVNGLSFHIKVDGENHRYVTITDRK